MFYATLRRLVRPALLAAFLPSAAAAQATFDLRTQSVLEGNKYTVVVQLRMSQTTQAGSGNLVFTYNDMAIAPPSGTAVGRLTPGTDYTPLMFSSSFDADYGAMTINRNPFSGNDEYSINIELNTAGGGTIVGTDWVDVVSIPFTVVSGAAVKGSEAPSAAGVQAAADIVWETDPNITILLNGADETTQLQNGTFTGDSGALPVELTSFTSSRDGRNVRLDWTTASETNNAGFAIEQATGTGDFQELHFVAGKGTTTEASSYSYVVPNVAVGTHRFRLRQQDTDGAVQYSPVVEMTVEAAREFSLSSPMPNPARDRSTVMFTVEQDGPATLVAYDLLGREVVRLFDGLAVAGQEQRVSVDARDLAVGAYVVRLVQGGRVATQALRVVH